MAYNYDMIFIDMKPAGMAVSNYGIGDWPKVCAIEKDRIALLLQFGTYVCTAVVWKRVLYYVNIPVEAALTSTLLLRGFTLWLPMLPGLWLARRQLLL